MAASDVVLLRILLALCAAGLVAGECGWTGNHHRFGPDCEFQCHCRDRGERCERQTGNCSRSACAEEWFGPGCQFRNAALGTDVDANYGSSLTLAVDGKHETCTSQSALATGPFVRIALPYQILVTEVEVRFKNYSLASGFAVYAGLSTTRDQRSLCGTDSGVQTTPHTVSVKCSRPLTARFVTVFLSGQMKRLEVCEIAVPHGRQLSYIKPVYYSSQDRNLNDVVNGKTDDHGSTREEENPWLYIDLLGNYSLALIELVNKEDARAGLLGVQVYLSQSQDFSDARLVYVDTSGPDTIPNVLTIPLQDDVARYVRITLPGQKRRIQLREVWVLGDCLEKRCGLGCDQLCYCDNSRMSMANRVQAICTGSCDRNWFFNNSRCDSSVCSDGKFGYGCAYDCNCNGTCHPWLGTCLDQTDICDKHYFGSRCQASNSIRDSVFTAQGNTTYTSAAMTVDGRVDTCGPILAGPAASWTVPLGEEKPVDQILIHVNERTTGYGLEVVTESENTAYSCDTLRKGSGDYYLAKCRNVRATHVRLRTRSTLQICEVAVIDCPDGTFGELCDRQCLCLRGLPCNKTTGQCPPGGCDAGFYGNACDKECITGTFGRNCVSQCGRCKDGSGCDTITGDCPGLCQAGWQGGRCDIECRNGTYGEDCIRDCGRCLDNQPCDKATGECPEGCQPGFYAKNCSIECVPGRYSYNCNETCGSCRDDAVCDGRDGYCRGGCKLGKQPPLCDTDCIHGTYGEGCLQMCGDCRNNMTCDPITGVCRHGCDPGVYVDRIDPMCTQECVDGNFGYNCSETCYEDICEGNNVCNKSTGGCLRGCLEAGVQPPLCLTECWDGTYGYACAQKCGMCKDEEPCNKTTGYCPNGCSPGFVGSTCDVTEWSQKLTTSSTIALAFGITLAVLGLAAVVIGVLLWRRGRTDQSNDDDDDYRKDAPPAVPPPPRHASLVSRVYDNSAPDYDNVSNMKRSSCHDNQVAGAGTQGTVMVENLWDYVLQVKTDKVEMARQFNELPAGLVHPCEAARKAQNIRKNRYKEIFPYDHSRVKLDVLPGDDGNDYINACFVSGYNRPHMYIAAQGPTDELVCDFWRMVWQKKCRQIVMLTRLVEHGKVKCCQYWPEEGGAQYGAVFVELTDTDLYADFNIRTFSVTTEDSDESREVRQFHYEAWPDRHVPESPSNVVDFWNKIRSTEVKDNAPLLVHCSAGIGRTGTFLALDYLADQASGEGYVNIPQCVQNLRHQRVNMLQNQDQYEFLHAAVVEGLLCPGTPVPCEKFALHYRKTLELDTRSREPRLKLEFEKLQQVTGFQYGARAGLYDDSAYKTARSADNAEKNRDQAILPSDSHRPRLTPGVYDRNDYINAVYIPTHREEKAYIVTQTPLAATRADFWQMVHENNVNTIIALDSPEDPAEVYWPDEEAGLTLMPFQIQHMTQVTRDTHVERTLSLLNAEQPREKSRLVKQFECRFWPGDDSTPPEGAVAALLAVHEEVQKWQQMAPQHPMVVLCRNGADKSGVYTVATSAVERLKEDREVALQQTIKQARMRRRQIITNYEQYKFCHDTLLEFLRTFDTFSNFYI